MTLRSILSPVDFSEQSRHALRWAEEIAARHQSRLTVLAVVDPLLAEAAKMRFGQDLAKAETEPALREFITATWPDDPARSSQAILRVRTGDPAAVILETATAEAVELIVMGTQGLSGLDKWILGSTTEHVLRRTPVPVLAVPPAGEQSIVSRAEEGSSGIDRILAATDFSEPSVTAVRYAARLADGLSATLTLAHVVESPSVAPQWRSLAEGSGEGRVADARARLQALADQFCGARGCETIVSVGRAADLIASIAEDRRARLIVMGLTGDHGRFSPRPGAIAYRVLCSTTVPVLVVPAASQTSD